MSVGRDPPRWNSDSPAVPASLERALKAAKKFEPAPTDVAQMESALQLGMRLSTSPEAQASGLDASTAAPGSTTGLVRPGPIGRFVVAAAKGTSAIALGSVLVWGGDRLLDHHAASSSSNVPVRAQPTLLQQASLLGNRRDDVEVRQAPTAGLVQAPIEPADERRFADDAAPARAKQPARSLSLRGHVDKGPGRPSATDPSAPSHEDDHASVEAPAAITPQRPLPSFVESSEAEVLLAARRALVSDPGAALSAVRLHERRFPSGRLAEEREVLAIEALRRLGRTSEADARSERFRVQYPSSIHGRSVRAPVSGQGSFNALAPTSSTPR